MPKRRFTSEDENQDFRSLGLTPASVLTVIPQLSSSVSNTGGLLGTILAIPYFIVNLLIKLLGSIFPGGNTPPAETPSQNQVLLGLILSFRSILYIKIAVIKFYILRENRNIREMPMFEDGVLVIFLMTSKQRIMEIPLNSYDFSSKISPSKFTC